ncbi:MAG: 3-deoxy-manno-octulosonate cytidylyltransferase, partial [Rhodobacteraceae bacterium]|nr:3-deoxy-manno-octulosonate cytidylyltransferase [Paracoccaceae bacterium]
GNALYFSKEIIPWCDRQYPAGELTPVFHHVGIYGYTREALKWYAGSESGRLEMQEGLEQLRFIEGGIPITCVEVEAHGRNFWELNNPSDIKYLEQELKSLNIA